MAGQPDAAGGASVLQLISFPQEARAEAAEGSFEPIADERVDERPQDGRPPFVARIEGLTLRLPSSEPVVVGFHEASTDGALELTPVGVLVANRNATRFDPPPDHPDGARYLVMASRGRPFPATSALDVVVRDDDPVLSPVSGTVTDVRSYYLYGQHLDHRVEIAPDDAPHLRLVVVHLDEPEVAAGDRVEAGTDVLAGSALRFGFSSQIDRDTEPDRWPHVHIEVKHEDTPRPGE